MSGPQEKLIRYSQDELALFARASHDHNPVHQLSEIARRSPYAGPIVFGALTTLGALARTSPRSDQHLAELTVDFKEAAVPDVTYRIEEAADGETSAVRFVDGNRLITKLKARYETGAFPAAGVPGAAAHTLDAPRRDGIAELQVGQRAEGVYSPSPEDFAQVLQQCGIAGRVDGGAHVALPLMCSSYVLGMELPGLKSIYSRAKFSFHPCELPAGHQIHYRFDVTRVDPRFNIMDVQAQFEVGGALLATGNLRVIIKDDLEPCALPTLDAALAPSQALAGKTALVVGASRGLGAALAVAFDRQGARTIGTYARSEESARAVQGLGKNLQMLQGDAASSEFWLMLAADGELAKLDYLVCNAFPGLPPYWIDIESKDRILDYVRQSLDLCLSPFTHLSSALQAANGKVVLVSSQALDTLPNKWPHYVAAKGSLEYLFATAAVEFPDLGFVTLRPPKLLTDQMNSPQGRQGAHPPEVVAARTVAWLINNAETKGMTMLTDLVDGEP